MRTALTLSRPRSSLRVNGGEPPPTSRLEGVDNKAQGNALRVEPTDLDRTTDYPEVGIALTCTTQPRTGQTHRLPPIPGAPPSQALPEAQKRRVQGVYIGCTRGAHRLYHAKTGGHPWGIRCTPLVHGAQSRRIRPDGATDRRSRPPQPHSALSLSPRCGGPHGSGFGK